LSLLRDVCVVPGPQVPAQGAIADRINGVLLRRRLRRSIGQTADAVAWVYLPHPAVLEAIEYGQWRAVVYDLCDDLSDFAFVHPGILSAERSLIAGSDLVVASSGALVAKAENLQARRVVCVPNAVDWSRFKNVRPWSGKVRRLLYIGAVFEWFDEVLLATVAEARRDLIFRVVGPIRRPLELLRRSPNVEIAGPVANSEVPREISDADIVIVPFRTGPLIAATDPLKVYEALAAGRPVIATEMPQLARFRPTVQIGRTPADWLAAIKKLEEDPSAADVARMRLAVARNEDWSVRFDAIGAALQPLLE
jgi:glycosyltransferase involved in cell wall biosynthesis